ncbi:glucosaminidase domain-containing protein, partial [Propionibacterium acidifaciens]|uniref:glucosaminidase domain-containing protein n=1 Tax=Propionibacterium acidifaciens TaxID=556499 RepID=UPI003615FC78
IHWSPGSGAHATRGAIRDEWRATGWENGPLGYPTTDEICGLRNGGCYQDFQNGQIHWSPGSGAHATRGAIRDEWRATGWENGPLGYPTTDEVCGLRNGGCYQTYQDGSIHWTSATGAHATHGAIGERWASQNWEQGPLGYPTSDEIATGTGSYQMFEGGAIIWTANGSRTEAITMNSSGLTPTQQDYLRQALPAAVAESQQYGVPVSVALGQSILESGWGGSTLSSRYNNYFGIKCSTSSPYQSGCINMGSGEYLHSSYQIISSSFRTYGSRTDSFLDHGYFLTHNSRYGGAFAHTDDPDRFIREVARAGYATDPNYAQKVINLMNAYNLYQYDI